jgi:hypothetical protein
MMSNSDVHDPVGHVWDTRGGELRPLTLVFAEDQNPEAIREALFARRTAVLFKDMLIGRSEFLEPIFKASVEILNRSVSVKGKGSAYVQIRNTSDLEYRLAGGGTFEEVAVPSRLVLEGGKTVLLQLRGLSEILSSKKTFELRYRVENLKVTPEEGLEVTIPVEVTFVPAK